MGILLEEFQQRKVASSMEGKGGHEPQLDSGYAFPKENEQSLLMVCERKRGVKGDYEVLGFSKNNHYIC